MRSPARPRRAAGRCSPRRCSGTRLPPARCAQGGVPVYRDIEAVVDTLARLVRRHDGARPRRARGGRAGAADRRRRLLRVARAPRRGRRRRSPPPAARRRSTRRAQPPPSSATPSCSRRSACSTSPMRAVSRSASPTTPRSPRPRPTWTSGSRPPATRSRRWSPPTDGVELIVGARRDPRFGPLVLVGLGGIYAELLRDVRLALAPAGAGRARGAAPLPARSRSADRSARPGCRSTCAPPPRPPPRSHGSRRLIPRSRSSRSTRCSSRRRAPSASTRASCSPPQPL